MSTVRQAAPKIAPTRKGLSVVPQMTGRTALTALVVHFAVAYAILTRCSTSTARLFLIILATTFEVIARIPGGRRWVAVAPLLIYAALFITEYSTTRVVDTLSKTTDILIPGLAPPFPEFQASTSGDARVLVGPDGIIPAPFASVDEASTVAAAVRSAIEGGTPFVTGDDFSIIIPARDEEHYITKTIQFIIRNTPRQYIKEILVIDDASKIPLGDVLDRELSPEDRRLVMVHRFDTKEGLIRARIYGADRSTGSNIFFLDGHCKPKPGWLEPLLKHLKSNYKRIACPVIQDIRKDTWEDAGTSGAKMMFEWTFEFGWYDDLTDEVPISAGGIIALTRKWWEESGKYDPGMLEWGGENLEQSMRVWLCGGDIFAVRDSFVGHIFDRPPKPNPGNRLVTQVQKNQKRGALVWLDEYYRYFETFHSVVKTLDEGPNLETRRQLRRQLGCLPFEWYVDKFRTSFEREALLVDEFRVIRHSGSRLCLSITDPLQPEVVLTRCNPESRNQRWMPVAGGRMVMNQATKHCLDRSRATSVFARQDKVQVQPCEWTDIFQGKAGHQFFQFDTIKTGRIYSPYEASASATLTGNDFLPANSDDAESQTSFCFTSEARFWDFELLGSPEQLSEPVLIAPCTSTRDDGLLRWTDSQAFELLA